jgi:hypothetical protein
MLFILIDRVIQEEGLHVYNMFNVVEKHFFYQNYTRAKAGLVASL